jgi:hypothetical protein
VIENGGNGISLEGRSFIIIAMCVGQLGSLLPHVVVPSILAAFLIPEWHLSGAPAGLAAGILLGPVTLYWSGSLAPRS